MRTLVKKTLTRILPSPLKKAFFQLGYGSMSDPQKDAIRNSYEIASMETSVRNLKALGFQPENIVDVGAYKGNWTFFIKQIFPQANVLMIEAQRSKEESLRKTASLWPQSVEYQISLLGAQARDEVAFNELETGSSVFEEQSSAPRSIATYNMKTLDQCVQQWQQNKVQFLKLDVQGYEIEILKGSMATLPKIEVVLMEVSLLPVIAGAPLLHDVVNFMKQHGFIAYDICSFIRRPSDRALWQSDFLFVRESSFLLRDQKL